MGDEHKIRVVLNRRACRPQIFGDSDVKNNQLIYIIFAMWLICFTPGLLAQKPHKPSKDEIQEITRTELERFRGLYEAEHERCAREYEAKIHLQGQLDTLRAAVAKAAKL